MDMVAAIRAAKNQLEEQKKRKGITTPTATNTSTLPTISSLHPAPPTNIVSFDSKKQSRSLAHPYHANQADYIHPDFQYKSNTDDEDDELTTTSSLSGTLPSSVVHDIPHSIHRSESALSTSYGHSNGMLDTVTESPGSASQPVLRSKSFVAQDSTKVEMEEDITPGRQSKSLYAKVMPNLPLETSNGVGSNGDGGATAAAAVSETSKGQSVLSNSNVTASASASNNNTATSSKNTIKDSANVSKRIDEIMSAYQGKVDTILKRRDEGTSFKIIIETASAQGESSAASSVSKRSTDGMGIDDILSTYKKKVGEIMEKKQQAVASSSSVSSKNTYNDDMEHQRQEISARSRPSYPRSIVDDETTESREGAIDKSVGGIHATSRGRSPSPNDSYSRSESRGSTYSGSRSYESRSYSENGTRGEEGEKNVGTARAASAPPKKSTGPMSERANAIWQSIDAKQPPATTSSRSLSPLRNRGGIVDSSSNNKNDNNNEDTRSIYSEESDSTHGSHSYISGASSASHALGSTYSHDYAKEGQPQDRSTSEHKSVTSGNDNKQDSLLRKDSLRQAQEQLARKLPKSTKSFYCEPNSTKSNLLAEIETERKFRQDLERRLSESNQREEDLSNENRRIEKTLADLQSQLDKVQGDARNNKFSQSEQAARIRELERKLKGEQNRVEELEREKEAMKEEYDADLEEQKDINRQLEQMVMSEEFEKELEDEINQVKELEHANRRFKVKIDMLEREKNTIVKKFEAKIDELSNKNKTLEGQLSEFESKATALESSNRNTVMELEAKLAAETSRVRELELSTDSAVSKYNSKMKSLETELEELRQSVSKIEEYEQVLGKLMERNAELETEAKEARDERDMANRQVELSDRRKAVKVKDLQEQVAEQKMMIEKQQETLEESVKTILKLYSLNNGKGDDMTELSEEQLDSITRAMIPRTPTKSTLPSLSERTERPWSRSRSRFDEDVDKKSVARAVERARSRGRDRFDDLGTDTKAGARAQSRGRDRFDDLDAEKSVTRSSMVRARSQGRDRFEEMALDKPVARAKSRGRGDRSESIRQLTSRALDSGKEKSHSPLTRRLPSSEMYDPTGPNSLALVPVTPKDTDDRYYGGPHNSSRRGGSSAYERVDSAFTEVSSYSNALIPYNEYDGRDRPRHRSNYHPHKSSRYDDRSSRGDERRREQRPDDRRRERVDDRADDRSRGGRSHRSRDDRHRDREKGPRRRDSRHRPSNPGGYHEDEYGPRSSRGPRESSIYGDVNMDGRSHNNRDDRHRPRGGKPRSSRTRDP